MTRLLIILMSITMLPSAFSQKEMSWKKHIKLADELYETREFADAASHYEQAWQQKPSKLEYIYKAAECYYFIRDFQNAVSAYEHVKDENNQFEFVGLKYARCLKQTGQYDAASREFVYFLNSYEGKDKTALSSIVETEIKGCELGIEQNANPSNTAIEVEHLGSNINTSEAEFAPIAFNDDILYFSSLMKGKAKIFRSQRVGNTWTEAKLPAGFKALEDQHFCNGSFSPDVQRFYFTICSQEQLWGGLSSRCEIYVTKRNDNSWTTPEKLPEYVNLDNYTNTHPQVIHQGDKEILFFSSNRENGFGGMDIWHMERNLNDEKIEFSYPTNAGAMINTVGDEITPNYDPETNNLFFSSNGHVSIGGYDIIRANGVIDQWSKAENLGTPINSAADEMYYTQNNSGAKGYFVSNRTFDNAKITTTNEDIFSFAAASNELIVQGQVFDSRAQDILNNVTITLYEITASNQTRLWAARDFENGDFNFRLVPDRKYAIEAMKEGYTSTIENINVIEGKYTYNIDFFLDPMSLTDLANANSDTNTAPPTQQDSYTPTIEESPNYGNSQTPQPNYTPPTSSGEAIVITSDIEQPATTYTPPSTNDTGSYSSSNNDYNSSDYNNDYNNTSSTSSSSSSSYSSSSEITSDAPQHSGVYFKIQLIAVRTYNESGKRYSPVIELGRLDTEYIVDKALTRVLLADFFSEDEARDMLSTVQDNGFERAFIVKYEDGNRIRRIR